MSDEIPAAMLKKNPQLEQIFEAIEQFKKTGTSTVTCPKCNSVVVVNDDRDIGSISTNCNCGYCKYSMSWETK